MFRLLLAVLLLTLPSRAETQPSFGITIDAVNAPTECGPHGWWISYTRTTTFSEIEASSLTRYFVQIVNDDINLVHYWGSGYNAYVQDYWVTAGTNPIALAGGSYAIPLWSTSYEAETLEYILHGDQVIWQVRAAVTCEDGVVTQYSLRSEPYERPREALPALAQNLVLALDNIPRYRNTFTQTDYLGTIEACQTFFVTDVYKPRASISVWVVESLTNQPILINDPNNPPPIVDVADDYGQPGGQPVIAECAAD
ncbi:MAG: hypothetical protein HY866_14050 [Chloroflexi bacterium]|nr:hypothetical protein [Chloroflexota bacterium]